MASPMSILRAIWVVFLGFSENKVACCCRNSPSFLVWISISSGLMFTIAFSEWMGYDGISSGSSIGCCSTGMQIANGKCHGARILMWYVFFHCGVLPYPDMIGHWRKFGHDGERTLSPGEELGTAGEF